jgi:hypothetical protein
MRTLSIAAIATVVLAVAAGVCAAEVHWVAAHDLAFQEIHGGSLTSGDIDADGDVDVSFIGDVPIHHFWNVGSPYDPVWQMTTDAYPGVASCVSRGGTLGDVDGDGDLDVVTTCFYGSLHLFENIGTRTNGLWEEDPLAFAGLDVAQGGSEPTLADLDDDGDLDLIVALSTSSLVLYENTGTPTEPVWLTEVYIPGVTLDGSRPAADLGDIDGDGDLDLVGGTSDTPPQCWENVGTPTDYAFVENPLMLTGVCEPPRVAGVELLDIDGDTDLDLMISPRLGSGNFLYLNDQIVSATTATWGRIKALYR